MLRMLWGFKHVGTWLAISVAINASINHFVFGISLDERFFRELVSLAPAALNDSYCNSPKIPPSISISKVGT